MQRGELQPTHVILGSALGMLIVQHPIFYETLYGVQMRSRYVLLCGSRIPLCLRFYTDTHVRFCVYVCR